MKTVMGKSAIGKRLLDLFVVFSSAPITLPLGMLTACAIILESQGGALFRQTRIGKGAKPFTVFKLRTMVKDAESIGAGLYAEANDPRFTKVGLFARRFSLDELPQLINVLRGEMSIVGPRPALSMIVESHPDEYSEILLVKPGLTGLSQINGRNALVRSERLRLDREYANNWTISEDIKIIFQTFRVVLVGEGQLNTQGKEDVER